MKYLIVGLGNPGDEYSETRHNIGWKIADELASSLNASFEDKRFGFVARAVFRSRIVVILKPTTYVNLSGRAVNYWLAHEKIQPDHLLIIVDDLALPFGTIRIRPRGGDGGHNGLNHITQILGHQNYARLRFGIGNEYPFGRQVAYVLGKWTEEEQTILPERIKLAIEAVKSYVTIGIDRTMNLYNKNHAPGLTRKPDQ